MNKQGFFWVVLMALSLQRKIAAIALVLYWPALFIFAHVPIPQVVREADVSDKSLHFLGYLVLVYLLWFVVRGDEKVNWLSIGPWWILGIMASYGVFDEWSQNYVAGRSCDIQDLLADVVGAVAGLVMFSVFTFWPSGLLVTAIVIFGVTNITQADLSRLMPVTSAAFHLFAYAVFTALWIQYIRRFPSVLRAPRGGAKWLTAAAAGPMALLLIVKLFSVIAARTFAVRDMLISTGGIGMIVAVVYLAALSRRAELDAAD
jgi:hypothetical protein